VVSSEAPTFERDSSARASQIMDEQSLALSIGAGLHQCLHQLLTFRVVPRQTMAETGTEGT